MWTKSNILAICFFITGSLVTTAQEKKEKLSGGVGYFSPGIHLLNGTQFNDALNLQGFPGIRDGVVLSFGGGGGAFFNNFHFGGEGHGLTFSNVTNDNYTSRFSAGYGLFNIGYAVVRKGHWLVYPTLGIGSGGRTLEIVSNDETPSQLNEAIEAESIYLTASDMVFNVSLHADYFIQNKKGGTSIGLYLGYLISVPTDNWNYYGNPVQLSEQPLDGFYLRLKIGGGGVN